MGKTEFMKLSGSQSFRQRLLLSTLSSTPILIEGIRADDTWPGLRPHEVSLLRLLESLCDGCVVEINATGTKLKYRPGIVLGGRGLEHDCGLSRAIGYFLEPIVLLSLFARNPVTVRLKGITNDSKDPSVDIFESTVFPILKHFGVPLENMKLKIESRGVPPLGGGEVVLSLPTIQQLNAIMLTERGPVKRIRGVSFSTRVSPQFEHAMIKVARQVLNPLLSDVHIARDRRSGPRAGNSPGFGISLVAETSKDCFISAGTAVSFPKKDESSELDYPDIEITPADDVGLEIASHLLGQIEQGGIVDSTHQGLLFLLCALCPKDISKVRVGKLSSNGIRTLRNIRDFLGVEFVIKPDPSDGTVVLKCLGYGLRNLSRKIS